MDLARALRIHHPARLALVGAGGKTSALFRLAAELPSPIWLSSTTHFSSSQTKLADAHITAQRRIDLVDFDPSEHKGVTIFSGPEGDNQRVIGLSRELIDTLHALADENHLDLLIEADGSRQLPVKAPADHEPVIPPWIEQVVVTAGMSSLGQTLSADHVHRPEYFSAISGLSLGAKITPDALVRVLTHPDGGMKGVPYYARVRVLLNQADTQELQDQAAEIASQLLPFYRQVIVASLGKGMVYQVHEQIAGIILAAGESKRLGKPKQLLDWMGEPFVKHVARAALSAGLSPVIVVTGASASEVENALSGMPVVVVYNPEWAAGQAGSIKIGVNSLPEKSGGAIFLLADQPQVTPDILKALVKAHSHTLESIIAPEIEGRRSNPVLFDRRVFQDLILLKGDVGGRFLFSNHIVQLVHWDDSKLLLDVDTPEDYQRFLEIVSHE